MRFSFVAQDKSRNITSGNIEAVSREDAIRLLAQKGLFPIQLDPLFRETVKQKLFGLSKLRISLGSNLTIPDQINIARHLGTILNTGTDLLSGLDMIGEDAINPFVRKMIFDVKDRIGRGEKFSDALKNWQDQFNPIFISLVKAGEASGDLPSILLSYAQELRKDYAFSRRLQGAMIYPVILVVALMAMLVLILTVVTPRLKELFLSTKTAPPIYTKVFFVVSDFWLAYTIPIIAVATIGMLFLIFALKNKKAKQKIFGLLWYLPYLNKIQKNLALMRFSKTLANLLNAGFSLKPALVTVSDVVPLNYKLVVLDIAQVKLEKGIGFAEAMNYYQKFFPRILVSVVKTGEKSGQLSTVLVQIGEFYEEEVLYGLELFLTLIEPILLVIVGLIVGLMASSLIAPIYRLIGNIR